MGCKELRFGAAERAPNFVVGEVGLLQSRLRVAVMVLIADVEANRAGRVVMSQIA